MTYTKSFMGRQKICNPYTREEEFVEFLVRAVNSAGICQNRIEIINFYVALKSKPLAIVAGPAEKGKVSLIQCLAWFLIGGDCHQCQMMLGHAWGAENGPNVAFLVEAQEKFIIQKLFSIIEEAWQPENRQRIYIACLMHISPAELLSFFTQTSFQLRHQQLMRLANVHLSEPIPYPPNLLIVGTMDTRKFRWWDHDLLAQTNIISWTDSSSPSCMLADGSISVGETEFLQSFIRNEQAALQKLHAIFIRHNQRQPIQPLIEMQRLLNRYCVPLSRSALNEAIVYLANSWSRQGHGLFAPSMSQNLAIALDQAIAQVYLPRAVTAIQRSPKIRREIEKLLKDQFPRAAVMLDSFLV